MTGLPIIHFAYRYRSYLRDAKDKQVSKLCIYLCIHDSGRDNEYV